MHPEVKLSAYQLVRLSALIKRRKMGEPVAYLLRYKDFYGMRFRVNKDVLIPRPETEDIIGVILDEVKNLGHAAQNDITILDVGTGSGCIAVALANQLISKSVNQPIRVFASDVSARALAVARANAKANRAQVTFIKSDLLDNIKFTPDVIVANLPYGWGEWKNNSTAETKGLKFEPKSALFTKENGLYLIRKLLEQVAGRDTKPKRIYLEFDPRQKTELQKLIRRILPHSKTVFHKDFRKLWRYAEISS